LTNLDISNLLNLDSSEFAWIGFTSATGNAYEKHELLSWNICPKPTSKKLVAVDDISKEFNDAINIYPNPSDEFIKVDFEVFTPNIYTLQIVDLLGNVLYSHDQGFLLKGKYSLNVNISYFPNGLYFVIMKNSEETKCEKLSIIK